MRHEIVMILFVFACAVGLAGTAQAQNEHWSRQFAKPQRSTMMGPATGMSDGGGAPTVSRALWHNGKLYMSGAWEAGVDATDMGKQLPNQYWYLWSWSPVAGYEVVSYYHSAQGGAGPDGVINDFLFLPDGRLVVAGEFTRVDNPGGQRYHDVNALAIYDPAEPTANKWQPLGSVQYNGTVSAGGSIYAIAYDPQGNHLYIGGTFGGIPRTTSAKIHRYDFDTGSYEPVAPGVYGAKPIVERIKVDTSTTPSTIYISGKFHYTSGNGINPEAGGTSKYSTGFAAWQEGAGWTLFPPDHPTDGSMGKESGILQRAGDYARFDSVHVLDFLVDNGEIWIVGAFSEGEGTGESLRGIAKWDADRQIWVDPTGKGGVGRDVFSIEKAANGKLYFAGAFGGRRSDSEFIDGFKNGDPAHMVVSYDPASGTWAELGSGLSGKVLPEARLAVHGNDVYVVGDFHYVDPANFGRKADKKAESWFIARWNEDIDFTAAPVVTGEVTGDTVELKLQGGKGPFTFALDGGTPQEEPRFEGLAPGLHRVAIAGTGYAETVEVWIAPPAPALQPGASGNEHWSRLFAAPERPRGNKSQMAGDTGMDDGTGAPTQINGLVMHEDTLYFGGNWEAVRGERWYVWSWHREAGWTKLAWEGKDGQGPDSPPLGMKLRDGKLYAYGAIAAYSGLAVYDIAAGSWSKFTGTFDGKEVTGNATDRGTGAINDIAWDSKTGDLYMVGSSGLELKGDPHPKDVGQVIRVDAEGNYHAMGHALKAEDPGKPILGIYAVALDETKEPTEVYIGGTFNYYGPTPSTNARMAYNVARWDHEAQDWGPVGKGNMLMLKEIDAASYPEGLPGLPARPGDHFSGFVASGFPRVRDLVLDSAGNLYAGGAVAVVDDAVPVADRKESFGIAKYDAASGTWGPVGSGAGVSRDVVQMTLIDDTTMLLSGGFAYAEDWRILNNVALLDLATGALSPLGGGLMREGRDETISADVVHAVDGDDWYFAGFFDHAGVNANSEGEAPIQANYVAHWNGKVSMDPNAGLVIAEVEPVCQPKSATSSESRKVTLTAEGVDPKTVTWYDRRSDGKFAKKASGATYNANLRIKRGDAPVVYVNVTKPDGTEGGKLPVAIPLKECS